MKLSKLVYLCVKNVNYYDDSSFTYESFLKGEYNDNTDYSLNINNAFMPLNEAISRLSDLNKIPFKVVQAKVNNDGIVDLTKDNLNNDIFVKELENIANSNYSKEHFTPFGINKSRIVNYNSLNDYYIEYKEDITYFIPFSDDYFNYVWDEEEQEYTTSIDIDLKERYGITDSMCNYIMEYVMSKLYEMVDANVAAMHTTRAEQYFANIPSVKSAFRQQSIKKKNYIGG